MSEPITVAAQLVRGEWADETAEGESGALEKLTDLMREAGVMIRDQYDELARMRKNSERWKFAEKHWHYDVGYDSKEQMNAAVDAAIAAGSTSGLDGYNSEPSGLRTPR